MHFSLKQEQQQILQTWKEEASTVEGGKNKKKVDEEKSTLHSMLKLLNMEIVLMPFNLTQLVIHGSLLFSQRIRRLFGSYVSGYTKERSVRR